MDKLQSLGIAKSYSGHQALQDVTINIPEGSIFGLLGPNGAGKTTLIRIINQIIAADRGEIKIDNQTLAPHHIKVIGYLPEERGLYKKMKVGEHLVYLARLKGISRQDSISKIRFWLDKFDILNWKNKNIEELSKGMQQKVQFIATIIHDPELIILDEPFSGFDPVNANLIKDEIFELKKKGSTIIFSTHRMESVEELCDHIALINKSKKILDGSKQEIKNKFRSNTFIIEHHQPFRPVNGAFNLKSQDRINGYYQTVIQVEDASSTNELLREVMDQSEVVSFKEKIPSINEIFINLVQHKEDE